jgi:hypothetical protein
METSNDSGTMAGRALQAFRKRRRYVCASCGREFERIGVVPRGGAPTCGGTCRKRLYRQRVRLREATAAATSDEFASA